MVLLSDSDEVDEGAAGVAADAAGGVWEGADDEASSAKEAPRALKENPYGRLGWSLWRDRRRLRQVSAPGVGEVGLGSGLQQHQVCSQPLKLLLLVLAEFLLFLTLSVVVRRKVV